MVSSAYKLSKARLEVNCSHLSSVELVLGSLQKVSVASSRLSRSRGDHGEDLSGGELLSELGVELRVGLSLGHDSGSVVGELLLLNGRGELGGLGRQGLGVVGLVPLPEGGGIDLDDRGLDEGVGSDKLVVGRVVRLVARDKQVDRRSNVSVVILASSLSELRHEAAGKDGSGLTTPTIRVFFVQCSEAQAKFPDSSLRARCLTGEGDKEDQERIGMSCCCSAKRASSRKQRGRTHGFHLGLGQCGFA
jgi:hypothetical protein